MESTEDVETLTRAIEKLLHEKRKREAAGDAFIEDHDDQLFLSSLISQLKSPELRKKTGEPDEPPKEEEEEESGEREEHMEVSIEELAKDIKKVKRQNTITHLLLSAMIILTVTWQLSEFSMVYMMKDRLSHPIRSITGMVGGMFKGKIRPIRNSNEENNHNNGNGTTNTGDCLQVPDLLREIGFNDDEE